jgi:hypothetical protein
MSFKILATPCAYFERWNDASKGYSFDTFITKHA